VLWGTPPPELVARLSPEHVRVVRQGEQRRAERLVAYVARRQALLDAHCSLIAPLMAVVHGYEVPITTVEELWAIEHGENLNQTSLPCPLPIVITVTPEALQAFGRPPQSARAAASASPRSARSAVSTPAPRAARPQWRY
jgi:hypothetical protein